MTKKSFIEQVKENKKNRFQDNLITQSSFKLFKCIYFKSIDTLNIDDYNKNVLKKNFENIGFGVLEIK